MIKAQDAYKASLGSVPYLSLQAQQTLDRATLAIQAATLSGSFSIQFNAPLVGNPVVSNTEGEIELNALTPMQSEFFNTLIRLGYTVTRDITSGLWNIDWTPLEHTYESDTEFDSRITTLENQVGSTTIYGNYLAGLKTSNNATTPNTKIDVAGGSCVEDTNTRMISFPGGTIDLTQTGQNGLDTDTLAINTWYNLFVIGKNINMITALFASTSDTPTLPSGYVFKRRIAYFRTDSSAHILPYHQYQDDFIFDTPINDINAAAGSTSARVARVLTVPPNSIALFNYWGSYTVPNADQWILITSSVQPDLVPSSSMMTTSGSTVSVGIGTPRAFAPGLRVKADGSSRVYDRGTQGFTSSYITTGWSDSRGR